MQHLLGGVIILCCLFHVATGAPAGGPLLGFGTTGVGGGTPRPASHRHASHLLSHRHPPHQHLHLHHADPVLAELAAQLRRPPPSPHSSSGGWAWARAQPFPLNATRLLPGSVHYAAQHLNTRYLHYLELDRLLYQFRKFAGLSTTGATGAAVRPYGGWENPNYVEGLINGHFTGHLLSALAFDAAATGDAVTDGKGRTLVAELAKCQAAVARRHPERAGWVSAYGIDHMDRLDAHNRTHVWAPYYTMHKIMAGLLDQYEQRGNTQALQVLEGLAAYLHKRISAVKLAKGEAWWQVILDTEFGGMNEVGYNLFAHTGQTAHRQLGDWFYKNKFMDPLAHGQDSLNGNHANCHLPEIVGVARGWEITGNQTLANITTTFHSILGEHYSYATGGSNVNEHWSSPDQLGDSIVTTHKGGNATNSNGFHTEETCTQYNALKMLRHLFRWQPAASLADDYEIKMSNGILGVQRPNAVGSMSYMTPLGRGVNRNQYDWYGFGSANNSFWCCYGTTIEQFAKLGDSIFFRSVDRAPGPKVLLIAQFIDSALSWPALGLQLRQRSKLHTGTRTCRTTVRKGTCATLEVNVSITSLLHSGASDLSVRIRVPGWSLGGSQLVVLRDGRVVSNVTSGLTPSTFFTVGPPSGGWKTGDALTALFAMAPRLKPINDRRPQFRNVAAIMLGPLVLGGLTSADDTIDADPSKVAEWVIRDPAAAPASTSEPTDTSSLHLVAVGSNRNYSLVPLNRLVLQKYTVYFNVTGTGRTD